MTWLEAFLITEAVEVPVVMALWAAFLRWGSGARAPTTLLSRLCAALVPSALTHPVLWHAAVYILRDLALRGRPASLPCYAGVVAPLELAVVLVEGVVLRSLGAPRPFVLALVANIASVCTGLLL